MSVKKTWNELLEELKRINDALPGVEELDGWIPRDVDEEEGSVIAVKEVNEKIGVNFFKPVGVWKEVYDLLVQQKRIWLELNKIAREEDGPAVFISKEFTENDVE